ncbi:MAG: sugar phosphate isomerase/epimerase [Candidatus Nealsonbacteria bacterium]|nr:MAG: sugar phosphate isomerase/epimerase [Candidatus Nealsonbacteria bacterium]
MSKTNFDCFRFGYMPSFNIDLISEIKFARKNFDFIEITLKYNLIEYSKKYLEKVNQNLGNFEILGHIHWKIDLTKKKGLKKIFENVKIYKLLGAKKITIHPFVSQNISQKQVKLSNLKALKTISNFCKKNKIQLLVENISDIPFNLSKEFKYLLLNSPSLSITLDVGHANKISRQELEKFLDLFSTKIKHIHLHYNDNEKDHLIFPKAERNYLNYILKRLSKLGINLTITLEIFAILEKQKIIQIEGKRRRNLLLSQLQLIKSLK